MAVTYSFTTLETFELSSAVPTTYDRLRVTFNEPAIQVDSTASNDALNPANYSVTGGPRTISVRDVTSVSSTVVDLHVDEMKDGEAYTVIAAGTMSSTTPVTIDFSLAYVPDADRSDFTGLGEAPTVLSAENVAVGILHLDFSEPMTINGALTAIESYTVEGIGRAEPIHVTSVEVSQDLPSRAVIGFTGGGSQYIITVSPVYDLAGNVIDPTKNFAVFTLLYYEGEEIEAMQTTTFDTNLGAISLNVSNLTQRRIDDLVVVRAKGVAHKIQFELITEALRDAGIDRDDSKLKLFRG